MNVAADDANTLIYDHFAATGAWPSDKWYRHLPTPDLWDPAAIVACGGGTLAVQAPRFTLTRPDGHDNVKALIYSTAEFSPGSVVGSRSRPTCGSKPSAQSAIRLG